MTSPWSVRDVIPEVSTFGYPARISLIGPSSRRRTCDMGTTVSSRPSRAESATDVYIAHPYFLNRSPAWVTIWSRGMGPRTATLRPVPAGTSVVTNHLRTGPVNVWHQLPG